MADYKPQLICRKCNMQAATAYLPHRRYSPTNWGASNLESIEHVGLVDTSLVNDQRVTTDYILVTREWRAIYPAGYQQRP
jgi:hypothetical protein